MAWAIQHGFDPHSITLGRICACSGTVSQLQLEILLRVTLTDADLRARQLQHTQSLELEQFLWVGSS